MTSPMPELGSPSLPACRRAWCGAHCTRDRKPPCRWNRLPASCLPFPSRHGMPRPGARLDRIDRTGCRLRAVERGQAKRGACAKRLPADAPRPDEALLSGRVTADAIESVATAYGGGSGERRVPAMSRFLVGVALLGLHPAKLRERKIVSRRPAAGKPRLTANAPLRKTLSCTIPAWRQMRRQSRLD